MPTYRAYLINGDNRVSAYRPIDAATDAEALTAARQLVDGCDGKSGISIARSGGSSAGKNNAIVHAGRRRRHHKFEIVRKYRNDPSALRFCSISFCGGA